MERLKKRLTFINILVGFVLLSIAFVFFPKQEESVAEEIKLESPESSFYEEGNVQSRAEYEAEMLVDPQTGKIPENIRSQELAFAKQLQYQNEELRNQMSRSGKSVVSSPSALNQWTSIGPQNYGGRTRALALDVTDENTILAGGVSGGVWRSTNGGQNWTKSTTPDQIQSVTAITQDVRAGKENIWYYGTGELVGNSSRAPGAPFRGDGIFKSTNGGVSWQPIASTQKVAPSQFISPFQYVWDITTDPNSTDDVILAAVYGGIVRSADGGATWTTVLGDNLLTVPPTTDLNEITAIFYTDIHRASNGVFYASLSSVTNFSGQGSAKGGVYRSDDGINWRRLIDWAGLAVQRTEIGSSSTDPNTVYFFADRTIIGYGLWRYNAATEELTNLSQNLPDGTGEVEELESQESYNMVIGVHPQNSDVVYLGGTNLYRSTDGFTSKSNTTWIGGYTVDEDGDSDIYTNHHPDQHALAFVPSNPNRMISANDGGIFVTDNNLAEEVAYTPLNKGYVTTQFYTASISRYPQEDFVIGGTQDNGSILTLNDPVGELTNSARVIGGDGGFTASTSFGIYYYMSFQNSRIYRLTLNSEAQLTSFARVDPIGGGNNPAQGYLFINPFILDPNYGNRMYLAGGDFIWRNQNLSQIPSGSQSPTSVNWKKMLDTKINEGTITALQVSTEPRNVLYYGTSNGRMYRVDNAHSDLYTVTDITSPLFSSEAYIKSIAVDPTDADHIMIAFSNYNVHSIFRSIDGGQNWSPAAGSLEGNPNGTGAGPSVRWVSIVPKTTGDYEYYAGTSVGLFSTNLIEPPTSPIWEAESPNGIGNTIVNMIDYRQSDGKIAVATHGGGIYTSQINNVVKNDNLVETNVLEVQSVYPNPFTEDVLIKINSPKTQFVFMRIYDSQGNEVKRITSSLAFQGENDFFWNGTNGQEQPVASGVYIIRITHEGGEESRRVILQRN